MKKVILGAILFLAGTVSLALILAGAMANNWSVNGQFSAFWNISQFGLMPAVFAFGCIAVVGIAIALWGLFEKER